MLSHLLSLFRNYPGAEADRSTVRLAFEKVSGSDVDSRVVFESVYGAMVHALRGATASQIACSLETGAYVFNAPVHRDIVQRLSEHDAFLTEPCMVEEGLMQCRKCGSKRTFSFARQTRSSDEGTTVFVKCARCAKKWIVAG